MSAGKVLQLTGHRESYCSCQSQGKAVANRPKTIACDRALILPYKSHYACTCIYIDTEVVVTD